jgi:hypothetical protein
MKEIDPPPNNLRRLNFVAILLTFTALLNYKNKLWAIKRPTNQSITSL